MKIALTTEYFPDLDAKNITGGIECRVYNIAKLLSSRHEVTVLTSYLPGQQRREASGQLKVVRVGPPHQYSNHGLVLSRLRFARSLWRYISKLSDCDILDSQCFITYLPTYFGSLAVPSVRIATFQETWLGQWIKNKGLLTGILGEIWERIALKLRWDHFLAGSHFTARNLQRNGVSANKISVIHNGFDETELRDIPREQREFHRLVVATRLIETKRVDTVLYALRIIREKYPELYSKITCSIIGDGVSREKLVRLSHHLGLGTKVTFHGYVADRPDFLKLIARGGLLIHPSAVEGFGIILVEAVALGVPVLASDIMPFKEVLDKMGGGRHFALGDARSLADAIAEHYTTSPIRLGNPSCFSWVNVTSALEQLYYKLMHRSEGNRL